MLGELSPHPGQAVLLFGGICRYARNLTHAPKLDSMREVPTWPRAAPTPRGAPTVTLGVGGYSRVEPHSACQTVVLKPEPAGQE